MKPHPVIIVGAGPVGLVCALRLTKSGVPVILVEKNQVVQKDLRASTFHPPTLEMLDEFGISSALIAKGLKTRKWQIRIHETGEKAEFDLGVIAEDTRYPFRLQAEQSKLCEIATELLLSNNLADIRMGHEVVGITQDQDQVDVNIRGCNGNSYSIKSEFVIAADGAQSFVRKSLNLKFEGMTYPETTILATTHFPFEQHLAGLSNVNYCWFDQGTFSLLKLPDLWRCSLYSSEGETIEDALKPDNIERKLQAIVPKPQPYDVLEIRPYRIHQRILEDYRVGRILFAGDAAHVNSPSGGMGMNGGIHDAWNLTDKLSAVLSSDQPIEYLDMYTRQRQPVAKDEILVQAHKNRSRMQRRDPAWRRHEMDRLKSICLDREKMRTFLLKSSMITGLKHSEAIS